MLSGAWTEVDDVVCRANRLLVMLDDEDGIAEIAEAPERGEEARVVALVEPDARLVEDVQHADEARPDLRGEPDALRLAAGERLRAPVHREVVETHVDEEAEPLGDFLDDRPRDVRIEPRLSRRTQRDRLEEFERVAHGEFAEFANVRAVAPTPRVIRA